MLITVLLFILGLVFLVKGGDWFVDGAVAIAERFHVPDIIIGATIVSIGTTLPEVMVSSTSAFSGHGEIAYGNAIGSIICNTALIAGLTIALHPSVVDKKSLKKPAVFFFSAAIFWAIIAYTTGYFARWTGIVLIVIFLVYMVLAIREGFQGGAQTDIVLEEEEEVAEEIEKKDGTGSQLLHIVKLIGGAALIAVGADLLVDNGTLIAQALGVPESVIALTFVALGTSLPELVTAITSIAKGHSAMSLGNVCGANLFNLVLVAGVSTTIGPYAIPVEKTISIAGNVLNASLAIDIPLMIFVMALLVLPPMKTGKLVRPVGIALLLIYAAFCIFQFVG